MTDGPARIAPRSRAAGTAERGLCARVRRASRRFFTAAEPVYAATYFRVFLALWTMAFFLPRARFLDELYTPHVTEIPHPIFRWIGAPALPMTIVWPLFAILLFALAAFAAGYHARRAHIVVVILLCYFFGFDISTLRAYGMLAFYQWLLCYFLPYDRLRDARGRVARAPRWGQRLVMLQLTSVYVFTVLAKAIHGEGGWFDGSTLYYSLKGQDFGTHWLSAWIPVSRAEAQVAALGTLATEAFVALGLWHSRTRGWAMVACAALHTGMMLSLRVSPLFHLLMMGHLPLFLPPRVWARYWPRPRGTAAAPRVEPSTP